MFVHVAMSLSGRGPFFGSFINEYQNNTGVINIWGEHPCMLSGVDTKIHPELYTACKVSHSRWHPSANRHRVISEVFAFSMLNATLQALIALESHIKQIIAVTNNQPNYVLACLLERNTDFKNFQKHEQTDINLEEYNDHFDRPIASPVTVSPTWFNQPMWCINSFFPTPDHSKLHHFVLGATNFSNKDILDKPVQPMIFRYVLFTYT